MSRGRVVIFGWADSSHVRRWATGLAARGFDINVISVGGEPIEGIPTTIYPRSDKAAYLRYAMRAVRDVSRIKPELVHCHYAAGFGLWTLALRFRPTLVSVWGSDVVDIRGISRFIVRRTLARADWISATGKFLGEATCDLVKGASERLSVIPFGVTPPDNPAPLPIGSVRLCFLKEHRPIYAPDLLLEAFSLARRKVPDIRLSLAGIGSMTESLKRRTEELGLQDAVDFPGYLDHRKVESFLSDHHILVMPSRMESFGVAALEASGCARPVIATRVGGIPEVVRDGDTGLLVEKENVSSLADAIVSLATDRELMNRMGQAGRRYVQQEYLWETGLDKMCELYDRLISNAKKNPVL
jgi:glycosyltransferase involved in cell wall biosynthesis